MGGQGSALVEAAPTAVLAARAASQQTRGGPHPAAQQSHIAAGGRCMCSRRRQPTQAYDYAGIGNVKTLAPQRAQQYKTPVTTYAMAKVRSASVIIYSTLHRSDTWPRLRDHLSICCQPSLSGWYLTGMSRTGSSAGRAGRAAGTPVPLVDLGGACAAQHCTKSHHAHKATQTRGLLAPIAATAGTPPAANNAGAGPARGGGLGGGAAEGSPPSCRT